MKEIIEAFRKWKEGKDEDWQYDDIFEFANSLGRGELLRVFEWLEKHGEAC
jgi:hypothetical protein